MPRCRCFLTCTDPTHGDVVGVDWSVSGTTYQERYSVRKGDTPDACATGIGNAINDDPRLTAALVGFHEMDSGDVKGDDIGYQRYQTPVLNQTHSGGGAPGLPAGATVFNQQHDKRVLDPAKLLAIAGDIAEDFFLDRRVCRLPEFDVDQTDLASDRVEEPSPRIDRLRDVAR
jgi:hypothetical protein